MNVIKDELDYSEENVQILYRYSYQKGQIRIRIRYNYSGSDPTWKKNFLIRIHNTVDAH
jgi:hypothetical protein